ncbi:MAG: prepilin peptidase [Planctomycetales bacterium]|nr:prepilin peptidase [Planctomycetales bacterium]
MNAWLSLPLSTRMAILAVTGACLGSFVNWLVYRWAFYPRPIGPWARPHLDAPPRAWWDRLPIVGWLGLRREAALHAELPRREFLTPTGRRFWLRPMLLEIVTAAGAVGLYWWELHGRLYPPSATPDPLDVHWQYLAHLLLLTLLLAATVIDLDEQSVPDAVTVPGTWIGHVLAACAPAMLLPARFLVGTVPRVDSLLAVPRHEWPDAWNESIGLMLGIGCFAAWCYAVAGKTCTLKHGWVKGIRYLLASLWRRNYWLGVPLMFVVGAVLISLVWTLGGHSWQALLSSLLGVVIGGGFIWSLRVIAGSALGVEAMGFGDVTLLAMIGSFLGWQAAILTFFLAPFCAIPINLFHFLLSGHSRLAFGPYLAAAALIILVKWSAVWQSTRIYFEFAEILFGALAVSLVAMALLLALIRPFRERMHAR